MIPFHCLVLCDTCQLERFAWHERLSRQTITHDLVGDNHRELAAIVFAELRHRIALKLSLGQRIAVAADDLSVADRQQLTALAINQGAQVIDLIGQAVIEMATPPLPTDVYAHLRARWKGLTIVGDVHGDLAALRAALAWAEARQHFVWLLGDVIDYGADTLATADAVYRAVMTGVAGMILGNHERKIARWLDHHGGRPPFRINEGNRVTIDALDRLDATSRRQWVGRFRSLLSHAALLQQIDAITLVHAATHPSLWGTTPNHELIEQFALYGEADHSGGKFRRVHHWIDAVPSGQTVYVGHDVMADLPVVTTGAKGGRVVHLDTGCGIGGRLSTADLRFDAAGLHLECFNRH